VGLACVFLSVRVKDIGEFDILFLLITIANGGIFFVVVLLWLLNNLDNYGLLANKKGQLVTFIRMIAAFTSRLLLKEPTKFGKLQQQIY
jgi:energy-converting hydrogenase Eha subunit H